MTPPLDKRNKNCDSDSMATNPAETKPAKSRPGGRSARVVASVMQATNEVLAEAGYDGLSIEEVAARSGVHKTTVYRRWPTKAELVAAAVGVSSARNVTVPDTGSFRGDLVMFATGIVNYVSDEQTQAATRSLVAAAAGSEDLSQRLYAFWQERLANAAPIVERAVARGELSPTVDPKIVIEAVIGPIWVRLLLTGEPVTASLAEEVVALVADGLANRSESAPG